MCVSQAAWVRTQVHFSLDYATPLSNFKVLMSQEWGGRRRSSPPRTDWARKALTRGREGESLYGFYCCNQPRCSSESVYSLQTDEYRLRHGSRAQKKSISSWWGGRHKGRGRRERGTKINHRGTVQNSPARPCSSVVHSHLCARVPYSCHIAWVMVGKI